MLTSPGAGDKVRPIRLVVPGKPLPQHLSVLMECVKVKSAHALFSRALEEALYDYRSNTHPGTRYFQRTTSAYPFQRQEFADQSSMKSLHPFAALYNLSVPTIALLMT